VALLVALSGCSMGTTASGPFGMGRFGMGRRTPVTAPDTTPAEVVKRSPVVPLRHDPEPTAAASDSSGVARILQMARVWQLISLHHPWVAARGTPVDSAFVEAATLVRRADHPDTLALVYQRFVAALDDPLTGVEPATLASSASAGAPASPASVVVETTRDSVLVLRIPPAERYLDSAEPLLREALRRLPSGSPARVVLDLRANVTAAPDSLDALFARVALVEQLSATPVATSAVRVRRVGGAEVSDGRTRPDDGWLVRDGRLISGAARRTAQIVIVANAQTVLPPRVFGLLANGATLVAEGALHDALLVPSVQIPVGDGLVVRVRTGELVHADGRIGLVADTTVGAVTSGTAIPDSSPAWRAAMQRVRAPSRPRVARYAGVGTTQLPAQFDTSAYPIMGARLLAGARLWHLMRERHAHRELYDDDIDERFAQLIPSLERATTAFEYARALEQFASAFDDAQVDLRGPSLDAVRGTASLPFRVRWIDGRALVTDVVRDSVTQRLGIEVGQELTAVDGFPIAAWLVENRRTVSAPNEWTRTQLLMDRLILGPRGGALVRVRDASGRDRQLTIPRADRYPPLLPRVERNLSSTSRLLPGGVLYLDVNRLAPQVIDAELARMSSARALLLDLRGMLPGDGVVEADQVADQLTTKLLTAVRRTPVAVVAQEVHRYRSAPCLAPTLREATQQCSEERVIRARVTRGEMKSTMRGPIVALIDERTRGAMERLAASLASASEVTFIGSATAGSPADVAVQSLPGSLSLTVPLAELRRTDGAQWQRVGITPVIESRLTVRTVRTGGDDVIDRAQQWLVRQLDGDTRRR